MPTSRKITTDAPSQFRQHALKEFKGVISDITDEPLPNNPNLFLVKFGITQLEVIEANEPYNFPVTEVEVLEIRRPNSEWAILTESIRNCGFGGDISGLIGKQSHWKFGSAQFNQRVPGSDPVRYEISEGSTWRILELEGSTNTTNDLFDRVADIANGKDATSFKSAFMSDMSLQGLTNYQDIAQQVMQNTCLDFMVSINKLTVEDGIYHKV